MALGQKEAVINEVLTQLPNFIKFKDNAILLLSNSQLEAVKASVYDGITTGIIEYSKDKTNLVEVRSYARSMVMNHLKKAKELNGGHIYVATTAANNISTNITGITSNSVKSIRQKIKLAPKGVDPDLLPEDLREYVKTLI